MLQQWGMQCYSKHQEMVVQFWDTILGDIFKLLHPKCGIEYSLLCSQGTEKLM